MITLNHAENGKYSVTVQCGGVVVSSPAREYNAMFELYESLKALDNDRLAVIRLTRLCIYQVCND